MTRLIFALLLLAFPAFAAGGFVAVTVDSLPAHVYFDATTVVVDTGSVLVDASPGKHFVSLFPPVKVYRASAEQAPEQFWNELRRVGAIGDEYGLLASYEAGAVRAGTRWIYVLPDETLSVTLSRAAVDKTYRADSGCAMQTFLGWVLLTGAVMILSVIVAAAGS